MYIIQLSFDNSGISEGLTLSRYSLGEGRLWTMLTCIFAHDTSHILHIVMNLLYLVFLGSLLERQIGSRLFLGFYLAAGVLSSLVHPLWTQDALLGASGATSAILAAFVALFPRLRVRFIFFPKTPVRLWVLGALYFSFDALFLLRQLAGEVADTRVAHDVHLAGGLLGVGFIYLLFQLRHPTSGPAQQQSPQPDPPLSPEPDVIHANPLPSTVPSAEAVDAVLDKMAKEGGGFASLTLEERRTLELASEAARTDR